MSGHSVFQITLPPGGEIPPHVHVDEDEAIHFVEGALKITYGEEVRTRTTGATINFHLSTAHGMRNATEHNSRAIVYVCPGAAFEEFFSKLSPLSDQEPVDMEAVLDLFAEYGITLAGQ